ncbi:MAG: signal peptide peptidase SppA [Bacteroidales bacterium]
MKQFFKFMFASMLGFFLTFIIVFFLFMAFIMAMISFTKTEEVVISEPTILHLKFDYDISDRTTTDPMNFMISFDSFKTKPGLNDILKNIEKAKEDDNIKGIYLDLANVPSSLPTLEEIRNAIVDFKESGKFVYAYGDMLFQSAYYLASCADKIYLNPEGLVELRGYRGEVVFIKGLLEKLEIEAQIIRHGKFKSAVEPFIREDMSEPNKEQTLTFISSIWNDISEDISDARQIDLVKLNQITDKLSSLNPNDALANSLVDSLLYMDQFLSILANEINVENVKSENLMSINKYDKAPAKGKKEKRSKNKVAIIYATGDIVQGEGSEDIIGSDKISRTIRQARLDEKVKAIVLRVNSPGGDGLASDIILREVVLANEVKPVVVSMGKYAASGGYYIACGASKIVANPTTLTGSIGVFGLIPNFEMFFKNKMGVTFDGVSTNENSDYVQVNKPLTDYQKALIQKEVDRFYDTFVNHVADGRNMTYAQVDSIAQGRVWTGTDAINNGLVDKLGGLDDAINMAIDLAGLEDYRITELPEQKEPLEQIIEDLFGGVKSSVLKEELGVFYHYYKYADYLRNSSGVQARLPFELEIK